MRYRVDISSSAQKQFKKFPDSIQTRLTPKLISLESNPRPHGNQKLRDSSYYRIRIGDYRIIYSVDDSRHYIKILDMAHRKNIYR